MLATIPLILALSAPVKPSDASRQFQVDRGLKIQLVAAEPLIADPVALCFDERGRMYVAENRDYPTGPPPGTAPSGTIALLEDTNRDGKMDRRTEFATGLTFPNGVMPWQGGLIVTCAPDVLYFKDHDGDGRADEKRVLLTGFNTQGSTQLRVSHPTLGADGYIYLTSGWTGRNSVTSPAHPNWPAVEFQSDSRFDPFTLEIFPVDGRSQFGQSFDDYQNRFICYNRVQVQHVVLPSRYLKRNPALAFSKSVQDVPEARVRDWLPHEEGLASRTYPISQNITTYDSHASSFSAACAVHVFRGNGLPKEYYGNVFSCDPTGNLVHRDLLTAKGPTFASRMANEGREFFASPDDWFRPVNLAEGPDGALYICDMYRKTIEHPDYLPPETRKHTDFDSGKGLGRIWKIGGTKSNKIGDLRLDHPNGWHREAALRRIIERNSTNEIPGIKKLLARNPAPPAQVLALNLLNRFDALEEHELRRALAHLNPRVREIALSLAEPRLATNEILQRAALSLASDSDPKVRFQAALSLGEIPGADHAPELVSVANRDGGDEWFRAAVLSSAAGRSKAIVEAASRGSPPVQFMRDLGRLIGAELPAESFAVEAERLCERIGGDQGIAFANGLAEQAARRSLSFQPPAHFTADALHYATKPSRPKAEREEAIVHLAASGNPNALVALSRVFAPDQPAELQLAAIRAADLSLARALLTRARWATLTPAARAAAVASFLNKPAHTGALLDAVEQGEIPASVFTARQREQLRRHGNAAIKARAEKLLASSGGDRMHAFEQAKTALALKANPAKGRRLFGTHCASCHRLDRQGVIVGPELVGMRHQPKEALLLHVIHPNYEVAPAFTAYEIETRDGRTVIGLLASESETSVTLRQAQGIEESIRRSEILKLSASALSLMPDEFEKNMSAQELADLIAYLKGEQ
jgi:putative membrane-bound dehydrogenase-like protein